MLWHQRASRVAHVIVSVLALASCGGGDLGTGPETTETGGPPVPETLVVALASHVDTLPVGAMSQFVASVTNTANQARSAQVAWRSSDPSIATVSSTGFVAAVSPGQVWLTASIATSADSALLVIRSPLTALSLSPSPLALSAGTTQQLSLTTEPLAVVVPPAAVRWTTADATVASVGATGIVTAVANGVTTVSAEAFGVRASVEVRVAPPEVASIAISGADSVISVGNTLTLSATLHDAAGATLSSTSGAAAGVFDRVTWISADPKVAAISPDGVLTGLTPGAVVITATSGEVSAWAVVTVVATPVATVRVTSNAPSISVGEVTQVVAALTDREGESLKGRLVAWQSSNPAIATVNATGLVTGIASGTVTVTGISEGKTGSAKITVTKAASSDVTSLSITPSTLALVVGQTGVLNAEARNASGMSVTNRAITWRSSVPGVVDISADGELTARSVGQATITAMVGNVSATASIVVTPVAPTVPKVTVATVSLSPASASLTVGQAVQLVATALDVDHKAVSGQAATFATTDSAVAVSDGSGLVTAKAAGTATITATIAGRTGTMQLTVTAAPVVPPTVASVSVTLNASAVSVGQATQATAVASDSTGTILTGGTTTWSSTNAAIASVSATGLVTGVSAGTTTIRASNGGKSGSATITVSVAPPVLATIAVTLGASAIDIGQTTQGVAVAHDSAGSVMAGITPTWTSSNASVAKVSATGLVTALAAGSATITASSGGRSGGAAITVTVPAPVVSSVLVTLNATALTVGQSTTATAVAKTAGGATIAGRSITWAIASGASTASVASNGMVTALGAGSATISATVDGVKGLASLTVNAPASPPPPVGSGANPPALPRVTVNVGWVVPTGRTLTVNAGQDLQAALNAAQPGDEIVLQAGATFTGNYTLPVKATGGSNPWILVRTSGTGLPALGQRLTPRFAAQLARIETPNGNPAIQTAPAAHHWRLVGLEVTAAANVTSNNTLVNIGDGSSAQNALAQVPSYITLDRVWVHGFPTLEVRRCIAPQGAAVAIVNSTVDSCWNKGFDAQAVWGWNGPGPFRIENNYLEGSTENVGFGGTTVAIPGLIPSDIEIRGNHIAKPASWKGGPWLVKNLVEFKNGRRILIENNLIEGNWLNGQQGYAIVLTPVAQGGQCGWCTVQDVTIRYNHIRRTGAGFNITSSYDSYVQDPGKRISITQNLLDEVNTGIYTGTGRLFQLMNHDLNDVSITHNTAIGTDIAVLLSGSPLARLVITNNVMVSTKGYGVMSGSGKGMGTPTLDYHAAGWTFAGNVLAGSSAFTSNHPAGNSYPATLAAVGFSSPSALDYTLASSGYRGTATDGGNPGADIPTILNITNATVVP